MRLPHRTCSLATLLVPQPPPCFRHKPPMQSHSATLQHTRPVDISQPGQTTMLTIHQAPCAAEDTGTTSRAPSCPPLLRRRAAGPMLKTSHGNLKQPHGSRLARPMCRPRACLDVLRINTLPFPFLRGVTGKQTWQILRICSGPGCVASEQSSGCSPALKLCGCAARAIPPSMNTCMGTSTAKRAWERCSIWPRHASLAVSGKLKGCFL